jgi:two-component system, LytTR family, sensor histidine kinase AlgZ
MHPVLSSVRRLTVYLALWVPIIGLLANSTQESFAVLTPAGAVYAFVCLTPWYICRVRPLQLSNATGLAATHLAATVIGGGLLAASALAAAAALQRPMNSGAALLGMGALLYLVSVGLHYAALAAETSRAAERRAAEARTLAREAELHSLRLQLNPHFLFNSLNSISALATLDGARAREMCLRLAEFLRASLGLKDRESIPLSEELALARSYLEVEQVRFGARLEVNEEVEGACERCAVPPMILQPLVENAVKHGIAGLLQGGTIWLRMKCLEQGVAITIENHIDAENGDGRERVTSLGIGQAHVRKRLEVRYGASASFDAAQEGGIYRVILRFPCEPPMASSSFA